MRLLSYLHNGQESYGAAVGDRDAAVHDGDPCRDGVDHDQIVAEAERLFGKLRPRSSSVPEPARGGPRSACTARA